VVTTAGAGMNCGLMLIDFQEEDLGRIQAIAGGHGREPAIYPKQPEPKSLASRLYPRRL